jgi:hypothetical protein
MRTKLGSPMAMNGDLLTHSDLPEHLRLSAAEINFDSTISRRLVHRNFIDHVLVTDVVRIQDDQFLCGARLPQSHPYFNETSGGGGCSSILLAAETMRQACIALSHKFLEISPSCSYILQRAWCLLEKLGPRTVTPEVGNLILDIHLVNRSYRRTGELIGLVAHSTTYCAGQRSVDARGEWIFLPKKMYERLRRPNGDSNGNANGSRPIPIAPDQVGRRGLDNIVITAVTQTEPDVLEANVVVDPNHPYFFEHKLDHVSGMLLLEACNQLGIAAAARLCGLPPNEVVFKCLDAEFHEFAALDLPITLEARVQRSAAEPFGACALTLDIRVTQCQHALAVLRIGMTAAATLQPVCAPEQPPMAGSETR